jgi:tripartite-type tricarboxylate transporter receptor subunit TctC
MTRVPYPAGQLRALALNGRQCLPDVPTFTETGIPFDLTMFPVQPQTTPN